MIYNLAMKLRAPLILFALLGLVLFSYLLIQVRNCCDISPAVDMPLSSEQNNPKEPEDKKPIKKSIIETRMLHFGDLMFARGVARSIENGVDPLFKIKGFIHDNHFDVVALNLEGPFTDFSECQKKPYSFRFEPKYIKLITDAGIDAFNLANNHSNDCYTQGIKDTKQIAESVGIATFGDDAISVGKPDTFWRPEGLDTVFLGFDATLGLQSVDSMVDQLKRAREMGDDRAVVYIHWGTEYEPLPNNTQKNAARILSKSGADLIIGHHPHVIEPAEIIGDTVVFYSLGNFVFDQDTVTTQTGYAVEEYAKINTETHATLERRYTVHPYRILGHTPTLLDGQDRERVCKTVLSSIETSEGDSCTFTLL